MSYTQRDTHIYKYKCQNTFLKRSTYLPQYTYAWQEEEVWEHFSGIREISPYTPSVSSHRDGHETLPPTPMDQLKWVDEQRSRSQEDKGVLPPSWEQPDNYTSWAGTWSESPIVFLWLRATIFYTKDTCMELETQMASPKSGVLTGSLYHEWNAGWPVPRFIPPGKGHCLSKMFPIDFMAFSSFPILPTPNGLLVVCSWIHFPSISHSWQCSAVLRFIFCKVVEKMTCLQINCKYQREKQRDLHGTRMLL